MPGAETHSQPAGGGAPSPDQERLYREHFLRPDAQRALLFAALVAAGDVAFIPNDHRLFGTGPRFFQLLAVRAAGLLSAATAAAVLRRSREPRAHDRAVLLLNLSLLAVMHFVSWTRPVDYLGNAVVAVLAIGAFYFAAPGPLAPRAVTALLMSASTLWFAMRAGTPIIGRDMLIVTHAIAHVLGIPIARRVEALRRQGFFAQLDHERARAELAEKARDLAAAKERAESLARAKSEFLATMSHEFRTPMNAVLGLSEVLGGSPLDAEQTELVSVIHRSARSLLVLLNDILDIAKVDAGRMELDRAPFEVREMVSSAVDIVRYLAAEKGLSVGVEIAPDVPAGLSGDEARLRQVLVNLLSNAVKFTSAGHVTLRARLRAEAGEEREVSFVVEDTGPGIAPEVLERLFVPFEQGGADVARRHGGTGLGLAICKRLVELMGGEIHAESELGRGSRFELWIRAPEASPPRVTPLSVAPDAGEPPSLSILLVEDNPMNQRIAQAMLARLGQRADVASDGREAIEAALRGDYELILMDLRMPEVGGIEAARRILAELPEERRPRIVAMTASAFDEERAACHEAGMEDFVAKPVLLDDLRAVLARHVALRAPPSAPESTRDTAVPSVRSRRSRDAAGPLGGLRLARDLAETQFAKLTPREREVCMLLADGATEAAIALELGMSVQAARAHGESVRKKLDAATPEQLTDLVDLLRRPKEALVAASTSPHPPRST